MVVIHISAQAKDGEAGNFEERLRSIVPAARLSHGCIKYEWYQVPDVSDQFIIYAEFDQEDNFRQYLGAPIIKRIEEELMPLIEGGPDFKHLRASLMEDS